MKTPLLVKNICCSYGREKILFDVSMKVDEGTIHALLGPNGAGKTSFLRSVLGLVPLTSGKIEIFGVPHTQRQARESVAYVPEKFRFTPSLSVISCMRFFGTQYGILRPELNRRIDDFSQRFKLDNLLKKKMGQLSKGQMQRIGLCLPFISNAKLWFLDEPFNGLDPIALKELREELCAAKTRGITIFINSHMLGEINHIGDSLSILNKGKCIASGKLEELKKEKELEDYFFQIITNNDTTPDKEKE